MPDLGKQGMTADDEMPWSAPWTEPRGAQDEAAFVEDVSAALYVPNAAPEIRMFAEVMAVLDIPAHPQRESLVNRRLAEERARREAAANAVPLRRLPFVRGIAAAAVAASIALGIATVSAYAGVLPASIQKVAHSVINAPAPKHDNDTPANGPSNNGNQGGGNSGNGASGSAAASAHNSAGTDPTTSTSPAATRTGEPGPTSSASSTHTNTPNPHSTSSPNQSPGGGKGHKSQSTAPTTPNVNTTNSGSTNQHHG